MTEYTISRENAERDWDSLRAILDNDGIVGGDVEVLEQIAKAVRAQIPKPAIPEPIEFGSVVSTRTDGLFVRLGAAMALPWGNGGLLRRWDQLDVVEVLRVGIGEPAAKSKETLSAYDEGYGNGQYTGFDQALGAAYEQIAALRAVAITAERKDAYDQALRIIHKLRP